MGLKKLLLSLMAANEARATAQRWVDYWTALGDEATAFEFQLQVNHHTQDAAKFEGYIRDLGVDPSQGLAAMVGG